MFIRISWLKGFSEGRATIKKGAHTTTNMVDITCISYTFYQTTLCSYDPEEELSEKLKKILGHGDNAGLSFAYEICGSGGSSPHYHTK